MLLQERGRRPELLEEGCVRESEGCWGVRWFVGFGRGRVRGCFRPA
jgi:hypothetical protein